MRRVLDLIVAAFLLVFLSPLLLIIAAGLKIDSNGPILYTPIMIGHHEKEFSLFRFRTISNSQLTRVGKFLRNYSLDHLPMLLNLLKGDLTLVGPRPMEANVVNFTDPVWQKYFQAKPGLFNYAVLKLGKEWTPSRVTDPTLNQELELEYLKQRSLLSDFQLFLDSLRAFIISKGNIKAPGETDADLKDK